MAPLSDPLNELIAGPLSVSSSSAEGVTTVLVAGVIDAHSVAGLERALAALRPSAGSLTVDLRQVPVVSAAGVRALETWLRRLGDDAGTVTIEASPAARRVLTVCRLGRFVAPARSDDHAADRAHPSTPPTDTLIAS